jgi:hypothetical protein
LEEINFPSMVLKKPVETSNLAAIEGIVIVVGAVQTSTLPYPAGSILTSDKLYPYFIETGVVSGRFLRRRPTGNFELQRAGPTILNEAVGGKSLSLASGNLHL